MFSLYKVGYTCTSLDKKLRTLEVSMQPCTDEQQALTLETARILLQERGFEMLCRFGHIHALTDGEELHICLIDELASMQAPQFLTRLDDALRHSLRYRLPLLEEHRNR